MLASHAVGIDLGTTYSCIAYLNEHGEPVTIPNRDGELSTPSVVLFDGGEVIVGTEALRNAIRYPDRVVAHAKRFMDNPQHKWFIQGKSYTPVDISTFILKSLLQSAEDRIGPIERAVITVPAQFSDRQRQATAEAGRKAGLKHVDIINEPVAAALCFVLGTEGIWFTELATTQTIMVVDLGGGTFDLSLVKYQKNEVRVIASGGDLHLGGLDWNDALQKAICKQFTKEFGSDPTSEPESLQAVANEVEQTKRSLSVRPKAALTVQHAGHRKTYQVEQAQFERITKELVDRMDLLTVDLLKSNKLGWAHVDVVLTTGGASRMPMVRSMLKKLSGRTLNTSLSPDQSIAHGATYYAGMLITQNPFASSILNEAASSRLAQFKHHSANARALGILIRDMEAGKRVPHYLLPANSPLPASVTQMFGTVTNNQRRVNLRVLESGTAADFDKFVELGMCVVDPLPKGLPAESEIEVKLLYDEQARIHVSAKVMKTGQEAHTEFVRPENLVISALNPDDEKAEVDDAVLKLAHESLSSQGNTGPKVVTTGSPISKVMKEAGARKPKPLDSIKSPPSESIAQLESSNQPIPLCNECGEPLDARSVCPECGPSESASQSQVLKAKALKSSPPLKAVPKATGSPSLKAKSIPSPASSSKLAQSGKSSVGLGKEIPLPPDDDEIFELLSDSMKMSNDKKSPKPLKAKSLPLPPGTFGEASPPSKKPPRKDR